VSQCAAICCSVLQCVAVRCNLFLTVRGWGLDILFRGADSESRVSGVGFRV